MRLFEWATRYGTLDQIRALKWVRQNIAGFNGDPGNMTVFGQSAGGKSVTALLISPLASGLFQRATVMSGATDIIGKKEDGYETGRALESRRFCNSSGLVI